MTEPQLIRGDARRLPLPDASVDLIVTSPPYYKLRSYTDGGVHYDGQIGAEPTPAAYIESLIACTAEWARVLKSSGSIFVNLGDKYNAYNGNRGDSKIQRNAIRQAVPKGNGLDVKTARPKSLLLLPERYRIAATDELGLIARAVIIWSKLNGLPESAKDRVGRSHEDWVHLTKSPRYFSAVDEIREPYQAPNATRTLGKLPGSVWEIATQPLNVPAELGIDHFAAFPMEWPRRLIQGWCPRGVCTACGEGRHPVSTSDTRLDGDFIGAEERAIFSGGLGGNHGRGSGGAAKRRGTRNAGIGNRHRVEVTITGYTCACSDISAPSTPGVVLDPFGGTGTTALVAAMNGRIGISVELSNDYNRWAARWRMNDPKERARAAGYDPDEVSAITRPLAGQFDVFGTEVLG